MAPASDPASSYASNKRSVALALRPIDRFSLRFEGAKHMVRVVFDDIVVNTAPLRAALGARFNVNVRHRLHSLGWLCRHNRELHKASASGSLSRRCSARGPLRAIPLPPVRALNPPNLTVSPQKPGQPLTMFRLRTPQPRRNPQAGGLGPFFATLRH